MFAFKFFNPFKPKKSIFSLFFLLIMPVLTSCSSISGVSQNVSNWAGKVARPESEKPQSCLGWQKIDLKSESRYILLKKDPSLLMNIDAHNLRGRNAGCWH